MPDDAADRGSGDPVAFRLLAETARQRLAAAGGAGPAPGREADIRHEPWWRVRTLRRITLRGALSVGGLLAFAFIAANTFGWWQDAVRVSQGPTANARARVAGVDGVVLPWLLPDNVHVVFRTVDGRTVRTAVAHIGHRPEIGSFLQVEYALRSPSRAAAAGNAGMPWGVCASAVLAAACLSRISYRVTRSARNTRALVAAARGTEAEPRRYVLLREPEDQGAYLLFFPAPGSAADRPGHLVRTRSAAFAPVGMADLRGDLHDGGTVVPWLDGRPAWPATSLAAFGPEEETIVLKLLATDPGTQDGRPSPTT